MRIKSYLCDLVLNWVFQIYMYSLSSLMLIFLSVFLFTISVVLLTFQKKQFVQKTGPKSRSKTWNKNAYREFRNPIARFRQTRFLIFVTTALLCFTIKPDKGLVTKSSFLPSMSCLSGLTGEIITAFAFLSHLIFSACSLLRVGYLSSDLWLPEVSVWRYHSIGKKKE